MASLEEVLLQLGIANWDVLLVGDGSGTTLERGSGWASILIDHHTGLRKCFWGGMSTGTVNLAELMPYLQGLTWYSRTHGPARLHDLRVRHRRPESCLQVHIVSDSEIVVHQGQGKVRRKANYELWAAMDAVAALGYMIHWHWVGRDRLALNMVTDHLSRLARQAAESIKLPDGTSIYDFNPGTGTYGTTSG